MANGEGGPGWWAFGLTAAGMLGSGLLSVGSLYSDLRATERDLVRIENKFDAAFRDYDSRRTIAIATYDLKIKTLEDKTVAHDLLLRDMAHTSEEVKALSDKLDVTEQRRETRFNQAQDANEKQFTQLSKVADKMDTITSILQQVVVCLNQDGGCRRLGLPFPYTGAPSR